MDSRTTTTEIVSEVIRDFDARKRKGDLAPRCNIVLLTAASMLTKIIAERSFSETFKQECDVIIVGAVIFVLAWEDFNNGVPQECFGNQYLYPLNYGDPGLKECENKEKTEDQIKRFGKSAQSHHAFVYS